MGTDPQRRVAGRNHAGWGIGRRRVAAFLAGGLTILGGATTTAFSKPTASVRLHLTYLSTFALRRETGTLLSEPQVGLLPSVTSGEAVRTALSLFHAPTSAVREVAIATVTRNDGSCFCWVVDLTPGPVRGTTSAGSDAGQPFLLVYVDAQTGAMWYNEFTMER